MRLCPTVEGSPSPLITHRIGSGVCQARQGTNFHKCHRCIYRGKPADWESDDPSHLTIEIDAAPSVNGTPRPAPQKQPSPRRAPAEKVAET